MNAGLTPAQVAAAVGVWPSQGVPENVCSSTKSRPKTPSFAHKMAASLSPAAPLLRFRTYLNHTGERTSRFTSSVPMPVAKSHPEAAPYAGSYFFELTDSTPFVPDGR
jgi:hypothetical protein